MKKLFLGLALLSGLTIINLQAAALDDLLNSIILIQTARDAKDCNIGIEGLKSAVLATKGIPLVKAIGNVLQRQIDAGKEVQAMQTLSTVLNMTGLSKQITGFDTMSDFIKTCA